MRILITAYDRYGNEQLEGAGESDTVLLLWPGRTIRFANHVGSKWRFDVDTPPFYEAARVSVLVNNEPLGYDKEKPETFSYANGINVEVGMRFVEASPTPLDMQVGVTATACVLMIFALVILVGLIKYRGLGLIRASSPPFLAIMLIGAMLEYASVIPMVIPDVSHASCALGPLLGHLGFFGIFGALFVKTQRIKQILLRSLHERTVTDTTLLVRLTCIVVAFLVYYAVWMGVSPPQPSSIVMDYMEFRVCSSDIPASPADHSARFGSCIRVVWCVSQCAHLEGAGDFQREPLPSIGGV